MNLRTTVYALFAAIAVGALLFFGACDENNTDDCPTVFQDKDGNPLSCTSIDLQCPNQVTVNGCDGTMTTISSSCMCTKPSGSTAGAVWVCADPGTQCPDAATPDDDGGGDGAGDETTDDDGSTDDGGTDDDGSADAPADAPADAKKD